MNMLALSASDGVAALALIVSCLALYRQVRKERQDEQDSRKAQVVAYTMGDRLIVYNQGGAVARAVRVEVDGKPIQHMKHCVFNHDADLASLAPGGEFAFVLLTETFFQGSRPRQVTTKWLDDSGQPGVCTATVGSA